MGYNVPDYFFSRLRSSGKIHLIRKIVEYHHKAVCGFFPNAQTTTEGLIKPQEIEKKEDICGNCRRTYLYRAGKVSPLSDPRFDPK